ncbi:MAG: hypothetical protein V3T61_09395 [Acidobacteriota bacterium]
MAEQLDPREAKRLIDERTTVTPQRVVIAKAIILEASANESQSSALIDAVLRANSIEMPDKVVLHQSVDPEEGKGQVLQSYIPLSPHTLLVD